MILIFSPIRHDTRLTLRRKGDALTINGKVFDFSSLEDGATLPRAEANCPWIAGDIRRIKGKLEVPIYLPHGASAPKATRFPEPMKLVKNGAVALLPYDEPAEGKA